MAISEIQLETWSHVGAVQTSRDTYVTIKRALESSNARYANRNFEIFLQGSYGNDTNIYAESDVDIVICCSDTFFYDLQHLSAEQAAAFRLQTGSASYNYNDFKASVKDALTAAFGSSVTTGTKAIKIAANGSRRSADVIPSFEHRRYYSYGTYDQQSFYRGVTFFSSAAQQIDNFPKFHSDNLTTKHQATSNRFKPAIRIFKNIRSQLVDRKVLEKGDAPSYFVEGLLFNVPNTAFKGSQNDMVLAILQWLHENPDRTNFVCANERHYLLRDGHPICWPKVNGEKFIREAIRFWNEWK